MSTKPTDLPPIQAWEPTFVSAKPKKKHEPLNSLLASAKRLNSDDAKQKLGSSFGKKKSWQDDAWEMFDLVGEQRFLATTLAGRLSQAKFYVGTLDPENLTEHPEQVEDPNITNILESVGGSQAGRAQVIYRLAVNLFIAGDGWLVGIPKHLLPGNDSESEVPLESINLRDLDWRMLSVSEIVREGLDDVKIILGDSTEEQIVVNPDDLYIIRVWRPHPRRSWEADSPTRASLPILRELVGLTMHISAQVDSRLAGAGLLVVPQSAQRALQQAAGVADGTDHDVFTEALIEAMVTPISDRASASAVVPLVVTVPDEATGLFQHISFSTPLDSEARNLRDEAIRRLALGQDAPPELLLGTGGMNHWGAWLVREDVVNTHLEPPLALICDALTTQYLWPVLREQGMDEEEIEKYVVWYDVADLVVRPNRVDDAKELFSNGVISDKALLRESGFDDSDAPDHVDTKREDVKMALDLARQNPGLLASPGLPSVVAQIKKVLSGEELSMDPLGDSDNDDDNSEKEEAAEPTPVAEVSSPTVKRNGPARPDRMKLPRQEG